MPESSHTPPVSVTPGQWSFTRWKTIGQLEALVVHHPVFSATVFLQGAHLTHFAVNDDTNWLWLSDTARFEPGRAIRGGIPDRKSTRLNSSHVRTSYAVFCLKKKT